MNGTGCVLWKHGFCESVQRRGEDITSSLDKKILYTSIEIEQLSVCTQSVQSIFFYKSVLLSEMISTLTSAYDSL